MKEMPFNIKHSPGFGLFHDTRGDVKKIAVILHAAVEKINELVGEVNRLNKELSEANKETRT